jgi:hypothetical protein
VKVELGVHLEGEVGGKVVQGDFFWATGKKLLAGRLKVKDGSLSLGQLVSAFFRADGLGDIDVNFSDVLFAWEQGADGGTNKYLVGLTATAKVDLANLPLAGPILGKALKAFPGEPTLSIEKIQLLVASGEFADTGDLAGLPEQLSSGVSLSALVTLGSKPIVFPSGTSEGDKPSPSASKHAGGSTPPKKSESGMWMKLDKSIGPIRLERIGGRYQDKAVFFLIDASFSLAGVTLSLLGLGAKVAFGEGGIKPSFNLDGMGLAFANGPIEIAGSLVKVSDRPLQLDGTLIVKAETFALTAIGSYADLNGTPSVMAFAVLQQRLGGPSFFFVTGLAFGFGVNRSLRLPAIDEVQNYPLIKAAWGQLDLPTLRQDLARYISPAPGNFWIAAGVRFSSFELLDSFVLLSVSFGGDVEIGLLGLSKLSVPKGAKPGEAIAFAELALRAVIRPADGSIQVEGRLTNNSYIFSKDCRLTGGFAFYTWFSGPHAGDFVVTLGGYHPAFKRPAHYPIVPRLAITWQVSNEVSITGEIYYALTPSCFMAGGKLCAIFRAGPIEAWFTAYADFLLSWQPFYYSAEMGISIGVAASVRINLLFCSFTISIRVELSVDLALWGPRFGGEIHVSLWVISFTIRFGDSRSQPDPLTASQFITNCLPPPAKDETGRVQTQPAVISIRIAAGLLREQTLSTGGILRIVNAHQLSLIAQSVIPCTTIAGVPVPPAVPAKDARGFGIRPMGRRVLTSDFSVTYGPPAGEAAAALLKKNLKTSVNRTNVPDALWGQCDEEHRVPLPRVPTADTRYAPNGISISWPSPNPEHPLPAIPIESFKYDISTKTVAWGREEPIPSYEPAPAGTTIFNTIWSDPVKEERAAILKCLSAPPSFVMNVPDLKELSTAVGYFQAGPKLCVLGMPPEEK